MIGILFNRIRRHFSQFFLKVAFRFYPDESFSGRATNIVNRGRNTKGSGLFLYINHLGEINDQKDMNIYGSAEFLRLGTEFALILPLLRKAQFCSTTSTRYKMKRDSLLFLFYTDDLPPFKIKPRHMYAIALPRDEEKRRGVQFMPCWSFYRLPEGLTKTRDYNEVTKKLNENGLLPYEENKIFWEGRIPPEKERIVEIPKQYDFCHFNEKEEQEIGMLNYYKYKYICDINTHYSWKLKYLFYTRRPIFMARRNFGVEYWYEYLKPWEHFVPIKWDGSNIKKRWEQLEADPALYASIVQNALDFAQKHLTQQAAIDYMRKTMFDPVAK